MPYVFFLRNSIAETILGHSDPRKKFSQYCYFLIHRSNSGILRWISFSLYCLFEKLTGLFFVNKLYKENWQNSWASMSWPNAKGHADSCWSWGWFFLADAMKLEWLSGCLGSSEYDRLGIQCKSEALYPSGDSLIFCLFLWQRKS